MTLNRVRCNLIEGKGIHYLPFFQSKFIKIPIKLSSVTNKVDENVEVSLGHTNSQTLFPTINYRLVRILGGQFRVVMTKLLLSVKLLEISKH